MKRLMLLMVFALMTVSATAETINAEPLEVTTPPLVLIFDATADEGAGRVELVNNTDEEVFLTQYEFLFPPGTGVSDRTLTAQWPGGTAPDGGWMIASLAPDSFVPVEGWYFSTIDSELFDGVTRPTGTYTLLGNTEPTELAVIFVPEPTSAALLGLGGLALLRRRRRG